MVHQPGALPYLTGAAGAVMIAFSAIFVRLADVSPSTAAVFRCAYALPALGLLMLFERRRHGPRSASDRRAAWGAGLFFAADLIFWHMAIEAVGAGLATVLGNCQVVFVPLAAWAVLSERPERRVLVAVPLVLGGLTLISGVVGEDAYGANPPLGVLYGVLTALAYTGFLLMLRRGNRDRRRPAGPLFDASLVAAAAAIVAGTALGEVDLAPAWPSHGWLLALALNSQVLGWLLISVSLPRLPAAVTSILLMIQPTGSVFLGMVLLGERPGVLQLAGTGVVLTGIAMATLGRRATVPPPSPTDGLPLEPTDERHSHAARAPVAHPHPVRTDAHPGRRARRGGGQPR